MIVAVGSALPLPAMSGADPCTGSNIEGYFFSGLMFPEEANPMPPQIAAAISDNKSPKNEIDELYDLFED
jgi:hypothetical protein